MEQRERVICLAFARVKLPSIAAPLTDTLLESHTQIDILGGNWGRFDVDCDCSAGTIQFFEPLVG